MTQAEKVKYAKYLVEQAKEAYAAHPDIDGYSEHLVCGLGYILPELVMAADGIYDLTIFANPEPGRDIWALTVPQRSK